MKIYNNIIEKGTILKDRYIVEDVLEIDGYYIKYIAYDSLFDKKSKNSRVFSYR